jgi:hypothetical protein
VNFRDRYLKKVQTSHVMKIKPVGAELFHADKQMYGWTDRQTDGWTDKQTDGQADMTKVIVAVRNFTKAPNKTNRNNNKW